MTTLCAASAVNFVKKIIFLLNSVKGNKMNAVTDGENNMDSGFVFR